MATVKFSKQFIQPNPLEVDYWVDIVTNPYGGVIKYFNGDDWVSLITPGGGAAIDLSDYYTKVQVNQMINTKATVESVESKVDDTEVADVLKNITFQDTGDSGVTMTMFKYNNTTVAVTLPVASSTVSGVVTSSDFVNFVKQHQLQELYTEMYDTFADIRSKYQPRLSAGKNIVIDRVTNTIHAQSKISTDWDMLVNVPDFKPVATSGDYNDLINRPDETIAKIRTDLDSEISRSITVDQTIQSNVNSVYSTLQSNIDKANTAIANETLRAEAEEYRLNNLIVSETELARANEATLQSNITKETERAVAKENELKSLIENHTTVVDAALALKADKSDTYTKAQVDAKVSGVYKVKGSSTFEQLPTSGNVVGDVYNISNSFTLDGVEYLAGTNVVYTETGWDALSGIFTVVEIESQIQQVATDLANEVTRATNAEVALSNRIDDEITDREESDQTLQSNIDSLGEDLADEIDRATTAESNLNTRIANEVSALNTKDTELSTAITTLQSNIDIVDGKLVNYQTKITSTNKLDYSLISGTPTLLSSFTNDLGFITNSDIPTSLKNPYALSIKNSAGTEQVTYDGSAAKSLTLSKAMVGLGNVENTALSSWTGSSKITTLGTISSGTWQGTKIANNYLANSNITISGVTVSLGGSITQAGLQTALDLGSNAYTSTAYLPLTGGTLTGQLKSTVATGTAPISVASTTLCTNLNADMLDGKHLNDILASDITGNAATATKLKTARTIWGQSFDGMGNVSGALSGVTNINSALYIDSSNRVGIGTTTPAYTLDVKGRIAISNGNGIVYYDADGNPILAFRLTTKNNLFFGEGLCSMGYNSFIYGKIIYFRTGLNGTTVAYINDAGTLYIDNALRVNGISRFTGQTTHNGGIVATSGTFSSTLAVTGATTLNSTLTVAGDITMGGTNIKTALDSIDGKQDKNLYFTNLTASSWSASTTYSDYGYQCDITTSGVTASHFAEVVFLPDQASSGDYAPVCETLSGKVRIFSKTNTSITIPTIVVNL